MYTVKNCNGCLILNIIFLVLFMQVESNGVLSGSENHSPEAENFKKRSSLKKLLESEKKQISHDFNDEQVREFI